MCAEIDYIVRHGEAVLKKAPLGKVNGGVGLVAFILVLFNSEKYIRRLVLSPFRNKEPCKLLQ